MITGRVSPIGKSLPLVGTGPNRDIVVGHLSLDNSDNVCLFVPCGMSSCSFSYVIQRIYCYLSLEKVFALRACRACVSDHVSLSVRGAPLTPDPHCSKAAPRLSHISYISYKRFICSPFSSQRVNEADLNVYSLLVPFIRIEICLFCNMYCQSLK